jgi:hypothetical protein
MVNGDFVVVGGEYRVINGCVVLLFFDLERRQAGVVLYNLILCLRTPFFWLDVWHSGL